MLVLHFVALSALLKPAVMAPVLAMLASACGAPRLRIEFRLRVCKSLRACFCAYTFVAPKNSVNGQ